MNFKVILLAIALIIGVGIVHADTYNWSFGDGTLSTDQSPSHTYNTAGTYDISLNYTTGLGSSVMTKVGYIQIYMDPPGSISGLTGTPVPPSSILWSWTNPADINFNTTDVWRNNTFYANYTNSTGGVQWNGLTPNISYTFSARTSGLSGSENATWINVTTYCNATPLPNGYPLNTSLPTGFAALAFAGAMIVIFVIIGLLYLVGKGMKYGNRETGSDFMQIVAVLIVITIFVLLALLIYPMFVF